MNLLDGPVDLERHDSVGSLRHNRCSRIPGLVSDQRRIVSDDEHIAWMKLLREQRCAVTFALAWRWSYCVTV